MTTDQHIIAPLRIGRGLPAFLFGILFLGLGVFGIIAGAGGGQGAATFGFSCLAIGSGSIAVGFWVNLLSKVEQRLADIQQAIISTATKPEQVVQSSTANTPSAPGVARESVEALMERYGITRVGGKYLYETYRYDHLSDAVSYAEKQSS